MRKKFCKKLELGSPRWCNEGAAQLNCIQHEPSNAVGTVALSGKGQMSGHERADLPSETNTQPSGNDMTLSHWSMAESEVVLNSRDPSAAILRARITTSAF